MCPHPPTPDLCLPCAAAITAGHRVRMDASVQRDAWTEAVAAHYAALDGTIETTLRSVDADLHWYALGGVASPFATAAGF